LLRLIQAGSVSGSICVSAEPALFERTKKGEKVLFFFTGPKRGVSPGVSGQKNGAHVKPSGGMVKYYTMPPSADYALFFYQSSTPGRAKARGLLGSLFVSTLRGRVVAGMKYCRQYLTLPEAFLLRTGRKTGIIKR
jgi:hypothetical protein